MRHDNNDHRDASRLKSTGKSAKTRRCGVIVADDDDAENAESDDESDDEADDSWLGRWNIDMLRLSHLDIGYRPRSVCHRMF